MSSDILQLSPPKKLSADRKPQKLQPVPSDYESDYVKTVMVMVRLKLKSKKEFNF